MCPSEKCKPLDENLDDTTVISRQDVKEDGAEVNEDVEEVEENELEVLTQKAAVEKLTVCKKYIYILA